MKERNDNLFWAGLMIEELVRLGCDQFVICPGSRSTPLTVAAATHPSTHTQIVYDERAAAYWAVGYARATSRPACVITTSGTAVANLMPAVVEASNDHVPILLLTADRPAELIDTGANQAIDQSGLFGRYVRWYADMPCPTEQIDPAYVLTTVDQAIHRTKADRPGPVHLNCAYREPLMANADVPVLDSLRQWTVRPYTTYAVAKTILPNDTASKVCDLLEQTKKGLVFVGQLTSEQEKQAVRSLVEALAWPVYADLASGLRLEDAGTHIIRYFDQALLPEVFKEACRPETVLHIGGRIVSKRVGLFLAEQRPTQVIQVVSHSDRQDAMHSVTCRLQGDMAEIVSQIRPQGPCLQQAAYTDLFNTSAKACDAMIAAHIAQDTDLTEPYVARRITELIPDHTGLFVSNSMPVRDVDIYGVHGRDHLHVGVNRGVSGIDGILATATGFAQGHGTLTTVVIGDLALLHDLNSLILAGRSTQPMVIVVINNHGGGIFRFLPIAQHTEVFEDYFLTPHSVSFEGVAGDFGLAYCRPNTKAAFDQAYSQALNTQTTSLIEVATDSQHSYELRKQMKQAMLAYFTGASYGSI